MSIQGFPTLVDQNVHEVSTIKKHTLGTRVITSDGREFAYAKNGGTELDKGANLVAGAAATKTGDLPAALTPGAKTFALGTTFTTAQVARLENAVIKIDSATFLVESVDTVGNVTLAGVLDIAAAKDASWAITASAYAGMVADESDPIAKAEVKVPQNAYFWAAIISAPPATLKTINNTSIIGAGNLNTPNTTYEVISATEAANPASTAGRLISGERLQAAIAAAIAAIDS